MKVAIGVDVGGTKIAAGLVDEHGNVGDVMRFPTPRDPRSTLAAMAEAIIRLHRRGAEYGMAMTGVGVGTGGIVDTTSGTIIEASDVIEDWTGVRVADELRRRTGVASVTVDNDGNTFALAEAQWGAARGETDALFIAVGTGIGGAIMLDGSLRRGPRGTAGEFGRLGVQDGQGCTGSLEGVAAGPALAAEYSRTSGKVVSDLRVVASLARAGDVDAQRVISAGAMAVGRAASLVATALDIQLIVIGGGVADIGDTYLNSARSSAMKYAADLRVLPASQGSLSSVAGAGALALRPGESEL